MTTNQPLATRENSLAIVRSDHHCFACGAENPIGLRLTFAVEGEGVRAAFVPGPEHQGYDDIVHGGIISTLLDEAMAWATAAAGIWAVTAEMRVRFHRPVHVGERTVVRAHVTAERGRLVTATATLSSEAHGETKASATATFMGVDSATEEACRDRYLREAADHGSENAR
jgi:uncharacterized protein (TIGR00369 family)